MQEMTGFELKARREGLEREAAMTLGYMLFEFSRLDMNLGLCLAWVDSGASMERMTKEAEEMTLKVKLDEISKQVDARFPAESKQHTAYTSWIQRAHIVRQHRNTLVHGRWGIEAHKGKVVNVLGLPTGQSQQSKEYTIEELASINEELRQLQSELNQLRTQWPL
jgi:hypothetical protein